MTLTDDQAARLTGLADDLVRRGFGEGDEFYVMTGARRGVDLSSEYVLLCHDDGVFEAGTRDMGRFAASVTTPDLDEAITAFLRGLVALVRGRRGLDAADLTGLPLDPPR